LGVNEVVDDVVVLRHVLFKQLLLLVKRHVFDCVELGLELCLLETSLLGLLVREVFDRRQVAALLHERIVTFLERCAFLVVSASLDLLGRVGHHAVIDLLLAVVVDWVLEVCNFMVFCSFVHRSWSVCIRRIHVFLVITHNQVL